MKKGYGPRSLFDVVLDDLFLFFRRACLCVLVHQVSGLLGILLF